MDGIFILISFVSLNFKYYGLFKDLGGDDFFSLGF